jgi:hypothetical protein
MTNDDVEEDYDEIYVFDSFAQLVRNLCHYRRPRIHRNRWSEMYLGMSAFYVFNKGLNRIVSEHLTDFDTKHVWGNSIINEYPEFMDVYRTDIAYDVLTNILIQTTANNYKDKILHRASILLGDDKIRDIQVEQDYEKDNNYRKVRNDGPQLLLIEIMKLTMRHMELKDLIDTECFNDQSEEDIPISFGTHYNPTAQRNINIVQAELDDKINDIINHFEIGKYRNDDPQLRWYSMVL